MANILEKIFYTKTQCRILDFIKNNRDSVNYVQVPKMDKMDMQIGIVHRVSIKTDDTMVLAELTKYKTFYPFRDMDISYTFHCDKPKTEKCKNCDARETISEYNGFASTVYTKMLNAYMIKHGCPVKSR
jgi:hypothetical protein